jgi:hypothetical protein
MCDYCLLGYHTECFGSKEVRYGMYQSFRGEEAIMSERRRQHVSSKHWHLSTKLRVVTSQEAVIFKCIWFLGAPMEVLAIRWRLSKNEYCSWVRSTPVLYLEEHWFVYQLRSRLSCISFHHIYFQIVHTDATIIFFHILSSSFLTNDVTWHNIRCDTDPSEVVWATFLSGRIEL